MNWLTDFVDDILIPVTVAIILITCNIGIIVGLVCIVVALLGGF